MGMFTIVIHPIDGRELQIKTGDDSGETYYLGDTVNWHVDKDFYGSGTLLDGIYQSHDGAWVIIKNHKIEAIRSKQFKYDDLKRCFKMKKLPDELWTKKAKKEYLQMKKQVRKEIAQLVKKTEDMSYDERMAEFINWSMSRIVVNYQELGKNLIALQPLKPKNCAIVHFIKNPSG